MDSSAATVKPRRPYWGLLRRRECWTITWRGWLLILLLVLALFFTAVKTVHPFLAVTKPVGGGALIVEGWAPDYVFQEAIAEFKRHSYTKLYVTGGPVERGAPLSEYKTFAELGAAAILRMGLSAEQVQAVPAPKVLQDRTYTCAVTLKNFLRQHGPMPVSFDVLTDGPHARRSWLLFQKGLGKEARVGIICIPSPEYDPRHWWKASAGVRGTIDELIAYIYARFFFHAPAER